MSDDRPMVACVPQADFPDFPAQITYSTYVIVNCPVCNVPMWLGQRGRAACEAGLAIMRCMPCVTRERPQSPVFTLTHSDP